MSASLRLTGHNSNVVPLQSHALATPIDLAALLIPLVALAKKFEFAIRIKRAKYFPIRPVTATNGGTNLFQRMSLTVLEKSQCFIWILFHTQKRYSCPDRPVN